MFSENIIQHISADITVATFHDELFGSGHFKISDLLIIAIWVVEFLNGGYISRKIGLAAVAQSVRHEGLRVTIGRL